MPLGKRTGRLASRQEQSMVWMPSGQPRLVKDAPCQSGLSRYAPKNRSGSPLSCGHDRLYGLKHGKLPFGFLLRISAIQTSLTCIGCRIPHELGNATPYVLM